MSLPAWGVWIEMSSIGWLIVSSLDRHSPHGECGLKSTKLVYRCHKICVTPRMGSVD